MSGKILKTIFSVENKDIRKVITVLGIKFKFKSRKLIERKKYRKLDKHILCLKNNFKSLNKKLKEQNYQILAAKQTILNQTEIIKDLKNKIQILETYDKDNLKITHTPAIAELAMIKTKYLWDKIVLPQIKDNFETIEELKNTNKSIIRFGDGEFGILEGKPICFQDYEPDIANRFEEILKSDDDNLMLGIPQPYYEYPTTLTKYSKFFVLKWFPKWHSIIGKYIRPDKTYYSTHISQVHPVYEEYDFEKHYNNLKEIWDNKDITVIAGDRVFSKIKYNIFENSKSIEYIYGPTTNAFTEYEALKDKISKVDKGNILIFALGPTGKILAYDMFRMGYRVLDLGHAIKDYDFYKKSKDMTKEEWQQERSSFFGKD